MKDITEKIKIQLPEMSKRGALIFDIDNTLVAPDDSLENYPELVDCFKKIFEKEIRLALVSGSPGAVIQNRFCPALKKQQVGAHHLTLYANGGSSKFKFTKQVELEEIKSYQEGRRISKDCLCEVQACLTRYLYSNFGLEEMMAFEKVKGAWFCKRMEQWSSLPIEFDDTWTRGEDWKIGFLDDQKMAEAKAGKGSVKTTFPFINIRQVQYDSQKNIESCSSFSPTGFYALTEEKDGLDLDLRDRVIESLKRDLKEQGRELNFYKAGRSTIDITHHQLSKASAIKDFIDSNNLDPKYVYYFGDEFCDGGNDQVLAGKDFLTHTPIQLISVNSKEPDTQETCWIGQGPAATLRCLKGVFYP